MTQGSGEHLGTSWSLHVLPAQLYLAFAFITGSLPGGAMGGIDFDAKDKLIHFAGFWLMQWTHARAFRHLRPDWARRDVLLSSCASATAAGGLLELWQFLLPHRTADILDWLADLAGALLGALVGLICARLSVRSTSWLTFGERRKRATERARSDHDSRPVGFEADEGRRGTGA